MTHYLVYDVFTDTAFGGNPLAIIPQADDLPESVLQQIAREFNFSETTFVFAPRDAGTDARVRIFTPSRELDFAGHPTIGTAVALNALGKAGEVMALELGVGPIQVVVDGSHARFVTQVPLSTQAAPEQAKLAACLSLDESAIRTDRHAPIIAGLGTDFVLIEVTDAATVNAAAPDIDAFRQAATDPGRLAIFFYARSGPKIEARMFSPLGGILEDPATGSASAALAAYLGTLEGSSAKFDISQGVKMGRPSEISAEVVMKDGQLVEVAIAGQAVKVMEGQLTL